MTKYKGVFNWRGQIFDLTQDAANIENAFYRLCFQIGKRTGYSTKRIMNHFRNTVYYEITEIKGA